MRTDELIAMLSTNVEAVDRRQVSRTLAGAVAFGALIALGAGLVVLGGRSYVGSNEALGFIVIKLIFATTVTALAFFYLIGSARPGGGRLGSVALVLLPFAGIVGLASISLAYAPTAHWLTMLMDDEWLECLVSIPIIAVVPFALVIWAVRQAAPTHLRQTGALAGLVAGGLSSAGYALHCTADSLPFVAVWYSGTIMLCTLAGAVLGPRLLRW
ncbi:MAG: NrsF family protein [Reyranella sp.]